MKGSFASALKQRAIWNDLAAYVHAASGWQLIGNMIHLRGLNLTSPESRAIKSDLCLELAKPGRSELEVYVITNAEIDNALPILEKTTANSLILLVGEEGKGNITDLMRLQSRYGSLQR